MRIVEDLLRWDDNLPHPVVTVGSFDGVHKGHQQILDEVKRRARAAAGTAAVLTLSPHPRQLFAPERAPNLLTTDGKKLELLDEAGMDVAFILQFNHHVAALEPERFVQEALVERCGAAEVVVGHDFRFGRKAKGDYETLAALGRDWGFEAAKVPPLLLDGERVSSTLIRELVTNGDLAGAERFLGRRYSIVGEVVSGKGMGADLGFPTANITPHHTAIPAHGVYAAEVLYGATRWPAAVNIGIAPTLGASDLAIEAHMLDFRGQIRGETVETVFHRRLRPERKYPSTEALVAQIMRDVDEVRDYFAQFKQ